MLYFDDIQPGDATTSPSFIVDRSEMIEFAERWDQLPIHIDDAAADLVYGQGGVTAPGVFVLAVRTRLIHQFPKPHPIAAIAALGWDELRFIEPVRPGDTLRLHQEIVSKRVSKSKNDRGIVTSRLTMVNQSDETVMSHLDTILVRRRPGPNLE